LRPSGKWSDGLFFRPLPSGTSQEGTTQGDAGLTFNPGTFKTTDTGEWVGGPTLRNTLFFVQSFESHQDLRAPAGLKACTYTASKIALSTGRTLGS